MVNSSVSGQFGDTRPVNINKPREKSGPNSCLVTVSAVPSRIAEIILGMNSPERNSRLQTRKKENAVSYTHLTLPTKA